MIKRISLHSLRGPGGMRDASSGKVVQYSTCSTARDLAQDDDLDEVAVISNAAPDAVKYGAAGSHHPHANGPRLVPGIVTAGVDRSRVITSSLPPPTTK